MGLFNCFKKQKENKPSKKKKKTKKSKRSRSSRSSKPSSNSKKKSISKKSKSQKTQTLSIPSSRSKKESKRRASRPRTRQNQNEKGVVITVARSKSPSEISVNVTRSRSPTSKTSRSRLAKSRAPSSTNPIPEIQQIPDYQPQPNNVNFARPNPANHRAQMLSYGPGGCPCSHEVVYILKDETPRRKSRSQKSRSRSPETSRSPRSRSRSHERSRSSRSRSRSPENSRCSRSRCSEISSSPKSRSRSRLRSPEISRSPNSRSRSPEISRFPKSRNAPLRSRQIPDLSISDRQSQPNTLRSRSPSRSRQIPDPRDVPNRYYHHEPVQCPNQEIILVLDDEPQNRSWSLSSNSPSMSLDNILHEVNCHEMVNETDLIIVTCSQCREEMMYCDRIHHWNSRCHSDDVPKTRRFYLNASN